MRLVAGVLLSWIAACAPAAPVSGRGDDDAPGDATYPGDVDAAGGDARGGDPIALAGDERGTDGADPGAPADAVPPPGDEARPADGSDVGDIASADEGSVPGDSNPTGDPATSGDDGTPPSGLSIVGFGAAAVGGWQPGGDTVHVDSTADGGPGSLREALYTGGAPRVVLLDLDGIIDLSTPLLVPSNVSIDARGHDVVLRGKGLVLPGSDQVILVNFAIEGVFPDSQDGVQIGSPTDPSEHVVLDHLTFRQSGDGGDSTNVDEAVSVVFGSRNITISWCLFDNWEKVMLLGNGDADPALDAQISVTAHHNRFLGTGRRHPQARQGRFDFFNNELAGWHMFGPLWEAPYRESFGGQIQDDGELRFENNIVSRQPTLYDPLSTANHVTRCESGGRLAESGTAVAPESTASLQYGVGCTAGEPVFTRPYAADVEPATATLRALLVAGAGNTL